MKKTALIFISLSTLLLFGCKNVQNVTVSKVEGFKIKDISTKGIEAEVGLRIKNPNTFGFKIFKSGLDVGFNGITLGEAKLNKKIKVKAASDEVYYFSLKGDFSKVSLLDIPKLIDLVKEKSVRAEVKGNIRAGNLFYKKLFPVNITERVNLDKFK